MVDNLLDTIATPVALVAGTLVSAAVMVDLPPLVKWTAAIIAGGGAAGLTRVLSSVLRAKSTALTAGLGNSTTHPAQGQETNLSRASDLRSDKCAARAY